MKLSKLITLTILSLLASAQPQIPTPQEAQERMRRHRERTRGTVSVAEAVTGIFRGRRAPGGLALASQCEGEVRLKPLAGSTLNELLNSFISAAPQYEWREENGVINVVPRGELPAFLEVRVVRFRAEHVKSPGEARTMLLETPEVREAMTRPDVGSLVFRGAVGYYDPAPAASGRGRTFSVSLDNASVREVLNAIARAHGHAAWTYRPVRCDGWGNDFELDFTVW